MHHPTPAERKLILAALPKPPEGKVWKQYVKDERAEEGSYVVTFQSGSGVGYCAPCDGFIGTRASALASWESTWRLAPAPKRPAKPRYRYAYSEAGQFIKKFSPNTHQFFNRAGVNPVQTRTDLFSIIKSYIKRGLYKELTRSEFLAQINKWGWNEDGTKIAPPSKSELELAKEELSRSNEEILRLRAIIAASQKELSKA